MKRRGKMVVVGNTFRAASACLLVVVLILAASACRGQPTGGFEPGLGSEARTFSVKVINQNFYDATIYSIAGGHRQELGRVLGNTAETLEARWYLPDVLFEVHLLAGGQSFSQSIPVEPGEGIILTIPGRLR